MIFFKLLNFQKKFYYWSRGVQCKLIFIKEIKRRVFELPGSNKASNVVLGIPGIECITEILRRLCLDGEAPRELLVIPYDDRITSNSYLEDVGGTNDHRTIDINQKLRRWL